ncbi:MAG: hypothetical protein Q9196_006634, partial [Gyalolechia fulgens]
MVYEIDPSIPTVEELRTDPTLAAAADEEYSTSRSGLRTTIPSSVAYLPFSHYMAQENLSSIATAASLNATDQPIDDKRTFLLLSRFNPHTNLGQIEYNFDLGNYSPHYVSEPGKKYATMLQMLQYPFSTGSIHIPASHDPGNSSRRTTVHDKPIIDPRYYGGSEGQIDLEMMAAAQRFGDRIVRTRPLADLIVRRVCPPTAETGGEDEDFTGWVRDNTITDWHPVGTCAMGGSGGDGLPSASQVRRRSVVDERLRVWGVEGLRVVDAS